MNEHEIKSCPRCDRQFECKLGNILECQCSEVKVQDKTRDYLEKTDYDCLCKNCLKDLNQLVGQAGSYSFPLKLPQLTEEVHYYKENNLWVFTEFYHLIRGHCCKNGCRHCAYGYTDE